MMRLLFALLGSALAGYALAEQKPLWEIGLGVGAVTFPAYRGSDERQTLLLPTPYFTYHGKLLRADRKGIRGIFLDTDRIELNISTNASIPVDSDRVDARKGMPDLKPTLEIGPSVDIKLWRSDDQRRQLDLRVPARYAFTAEANPQAAGWQFTPRLNFDLIDPLGFNGWNFGVLAGPVYGSKRQHDYFYSVAERYATATRSAYDAPGGYAGWQLLSAVSKRFPGYWVGGFIRYDSLRGAVFANSPLVTSDHYVAGGIAISWIIGKSSQRIETND
ncbi:MAG TPA: MipA/OmpV family protein [Spongiibacteraceae bacterium]|jgi:outer membrane scaffolding protein for murein synthesis (MipA/OmpV family)